MRGKYWKLSRIATVRVAMRVRVIVYSTVAIMLMLLVPDACTAMTLIQAVEAARVNDMETAAARNDRDAAAEQTTQGWAQLLPRVNVEASHTANNGQTDYWQSNSGYQRVSQAGLVLKQPLFDVPRYARFKRGHTLSDIGGAVLDEAEQKLLLTVSELFLDVLAAREQVAAVKYGREELEKRLAVVKEEARLGVSSPVDLDEAQAAFDEAVVEEQASAHEHDVKRSELWRVTGLRGEDALGEFAELEASDFDMGDLDGMRSLALAHHPNLRRRQLEVVAAGQSVQEQKGEFAPKLELVARHDYRHYHDATHNRQVQSPSNMVGLNFSIPLYSGGEMRSRLREARYSEASKQNQLFATRLAVTNSVEKNFLAATAGLSQIYAGKRRLASAVRKLESTALGKDLGIRSNLDILKAEKERTDAARKLAQAYQGFHAARLKLAFDTGRLDDEMLMKTQRALNVKVSQ